MKLGAHDVSHRNIWFECRLLRHYLHSFDAFASPIFWATIWKNAVYKRALSDLSPLLRKKPPRSRWKALNEALRLTMDKFNVFRLAFLMSSQRQHADHLPPFPSNLQTMITILRYRYCRSTLVWSILLTAFSVLGQSTLRAVLNPTNSLFLGKSFEEGFFVLVKFADVL